MTLQDPRGSALALAEPAPADAEARRIDHEAVGRAARDLLRALGVDVDAGALEETPRRVADAYAELLTPKPFQATTFPNDEGYDELIVARAIPFHSLCMHHLLPFQGVAHVGYLPGERIIGLSKLGRVVEFFSRDLQIQERLTTQVADWLQRELEPKGVGVVLEAEHMCMSLRGVQKLGARTVTSALRGLVRDDPVLARSSWPLPRGAHMTTDQTHVIVGASLAGAKAAETLREEGFDGRVVLLGVEEERPYERPPLSKEYLRGEAGREKVYVHGERFYEEHDIELRLGRAAVRLDTANCEVELNGGERLRYDRLLLTTGSEPRRLQIPGAELEGVYYLRSVQDSDALRERVDRGGAVVVVGAGWIGAEVAASARQRGLEVTVVEPASLPLERVLGTELGAIYRDIHADHGVRMLLGTGVEAFEGNGAVERVRTSDGRLVDCDFVVVGVGVQPRIELAAAAGLAVSNGVLVDERLRATAPGVFAAGDVANAVHPFYAEPVRVEHWANALNQGPAAARNMLGQSAPYDRLPYFFSDQYDVGMEYTGLSRGYDRVVFRGDPAQPEFVAFWMFEDRVMAGMNVNVWDVTDPIKRLISERIAVEDRQLANPDLPLDELASARGAVT